MSDIKLQARKTTKRLVSLPEDQWLLIDGCAKALGLSGRSTFLHIFLDKYTEHVISFTHGWLAGNEYYREQLSKAKNLQQAVEIIKALGGPAVKIVGAS